MLKRPRTDSEVSDRKERKARIGFAVVGLGRAGHFHLTSLQMLVERAELKWVIDTDETKMKDIAKQYSCKGSKDLGDALKDPGVVAVVICSVTYSHYGFIKAALEAGKAVFAEKPISHDPLELREILDMAKKSKRPFVVGYQRRVDLNFRELKRQLDSGVAGDLRMVKCCSRDNPLPPIEYLRVSGGIFYDMLCHDFDMIHFLTDQIPEEVYSVGHCYDERIKEFNDIDTVMVTMRFKSGLIATVDCSRTAAYGYDQRVELLGEKGMVTAHNEQTSNVVVATKDGFMHSTAKYSFPERYKESYSTELAEFLSLLEDGGVESDALIERHAKLDVVTTAAELSYRLGRAVKLEEVPSLRHHIKH